MKVLAISNEDNQKILFDVIQKDRQERLASAILSTETLSKLNITLDTLPKKCQQLLNRVAEVQISTQMNHLDPISMSVHQSKQTVTKLQDEYEILKLKQKNEELQVKIDRNNKFLENLRMELINSQESLMKQTPNPNDIHEVIRQLKQKVASYEESCEKAKAKFTKLSVPEGVMPKSLEELITTLATLKAEAVTLKQQADDITLAREARDTLSRLRR